MRVQLELRESCVHPRASIGAHGLDPLAALQNVGEQQQRAEKERKQNNNWVEQWVIAGITLIQNSNIQEPSAISEVVVRPFSWQRSLGRDPELTRSSRNPWQQWQAAQQRLGCYQLNSVDLVPARPRILMETA
jgi:hypothetical protein